LLKVLVVVAVVVGAVNYVLYLKTGRTVVDADLPGRLALPALPDVAAPLKDLTRTLSRSETQATGAVTRVYKWRDASGQTHYSKSPPPADTPTEILKVDTGTNVLPALSQGPTPRPARDTSPAAPEPSRTDFYAPEKVRELIDEAREVQGALDQRFAQQKQIIEQAQ